MLLRTAKLFVHSKEVFLQCKLSPTDLEQMPNERLKEFIWHLLPCDHMDPKNKYTHMGLRVIREFMSLSGKFQRFLQQIHGIGDDPEVSHAKLLKLLPSHLELLRCYCLEFNRKLVDFEGGVEAQEKIEVIMEQLNHYLGKRPDQKNVVECALYFEEYLRRVIEERNEGPDYEVPKDKISITGRSEKLNIKSEVDFDVDTDDEGLRMTEHTELKLKLGELKRKHIAVCKQRDELNELLGKMMHKNVRLKKREESLRGMNKKLKKKLHKKTKLIKKGREL